MPTVSEYELALSMMRQWGKDARCSARNYAIDGFRKGDTAEFCKWHDVGRIIEQMQVNGIVSIGSCQVGSAALRCESAGSSAPPLSTNC